jgi:hypothetical protein
MHSPTGYYALITTVRHITGADGTKVEDWSVTETYPVVSFQSGESMIVNRKGQLRRAREYAQEIYDEYAGSAEEGVRFDVALDVTPHEGDVTAAGGTL